MKHTKECRNAEARMRRSLAKLDNASNEPDKPGQFRGLRAKWLDLRAKWLDARERCPKCWHA
jgi:hypothetical protein